jgi:hypothetical protein
MEMEVNMDKTFSPIFTVSVNQQLDKVGDEFMNERDFEIVVNLNIGSEYVVCFIDGKPDCYIRKADILALSSIISLLNESGRLT